MKKLLLSLALVAVLSATSIADRRYYVWTYQFATIPTGELELEHYLTLKLNDVNFKENAIWENWFEFELGLTDRLDISFYIMFTQDNSVNSGLSFTGLKIRSRYKLAEYGEFFVNPLIYLEYVQSSRLEKSGKIEGKLVLSKAPFRKFDVSVNLTGEYEIGVSKFETGYTVGLSYEFDPRIRVGLETVGDFEGSKFAVGPTVSLASKKLWISLGVLFGGTKKADDVMFRSLIGIEF